MVSFWFDPEFDDLYVTVHLSQSDSFWGRVRTAVRYVFGQRSRYGDWDEFLLNQDDVPKILKILNDYLAQQEEKANEGRSESTVD